MVVQLSIFRIVCDFVVIVMLAIPLLIFHEWVQPYKRGFYCDDESIHYPYKDSTVSRRVLAVVGILISVALILFSECYRSLAWERNCQHLYRAYQCRQRNVHRIIVRLYVFIGYFLVGACFNQLMVDIAKYTIGRHRPHFLDICKPDVGYKSCPPTYSYITDFKCTDQRTDLIRESMLSFYSGHSAFSFYTAWFIALYLQARLYRPLGSRLVLPVIQFSLFGCAAYVAYTRVSDYKHHWSDVLVGAVMGSAIGMINALFIAKVFERREIPTGTEREKFFQMDSPKPQNANVELNTVNSDNNSRGNVSAQNNINIPIIQSYTSPAGVR